MKRTRTLGIIALVCACFAVIGLTNIPRWLKYKNGDIKDLNDQSLTLETGDLIEGTVDMVLGAAAEEYSTTFGVRTSSGSSKLYYVLWLDNNNLVLYETGSSSEYDTLDKITDETYDYFDSLETYDETGDLNDLVPISTDMEIQGTVSSMPSDIKGYFQEWYDDVFDDGEFNSSTEVCMISHAVFDRMYINVIIGVVGAVLAVLFLILTIVSHKKDKQSAY